MTALSPLDAVFASIAALRDRPATTETKPDDQTGFPNPTTATVVALPVPRPTAHPVRSFFQVLEDHGLDGLIDADHEEAARLWTAGAPAPSGNWSETL